MQGAPGGGEGAANALLDLVELVLRQFERVDGIAHQAVAGAESAAGHRTGTPFASRKPEILSCKINIL